MDTKYPNGNTAKIIQSNKDMKMETCSVYNLCHVCEIVLSFGCGDSEFLIFNKSNVYK